MWYLFDNKTGEFWGGFEGLDQANLYLTKTLKWSHARVGGWHEKAVDFIGTNSFVMQYDAEGEDPPVAFVNEVDATLLGTLAARASKFFREDRRQLRIAQVEELVAKFPAPKPEAKPKAKTKK